VELACSKPVELRARQYGLRITDDLLTGGHHEKTRKEKLVWSPESERTSMHRTIERACAGNRAILREFADWLEARGLGLESITARLRSASSFIDAVTAGAGAACAMAF